MSEPNLAYPDVDLVVAFHRQLMQRLGQGEPGAVDEPRLKSILDRAMSAARDQRGDIVWLTAYLLFELVRGKPFAKANTQTAIALTLAFLHRNGITLAVPPEEMAGVGLGVSQGGVYVAMVEMWLRDSMRRLPQ